jgi:general secretion pathway protein A
VKQESPVTATSELRDSYLRHFFLLEEPFSLTPDPGFLYLSPGHADALAALELGILERRGLIVLVGEVGTGKTTLAYSIVRGLGAGVRAAYLSNSTLPFAHLLRSALKDLGVESQSRDKGDLLDALAAMLHKADEAGEIVVLILDEAQNLSLETFEELRLLLNFETEKNKLLQLVLIGQPELQQKLKDRRLRHVADRIAVRCALAPLSPIEAKRYIEHRLNTAGGIIDIFSPAALTQITRASKGIPRSINVLCHNAILFAYGKNLNKIDWSTVSQAVRERQGGVIGSRLQQLLPKTWLGKVAVGGIVLILGMLLLLWWGQADSEAGAAAGSGAVAPPAEQPPAPAPAPVVVEGTLAPAEESVAEPSKMVQITAGQNLTALILEAYGRFDEEVLSRVLAANPQIRDPNMIVEGDVVRLPPMLAEAIGEGQR